MSRAAIPRPPRIPKARASVPSPDPPTEPVGTQGRLSAHLHTQHAFLVDYTPGARGNHTLPSDFSPVPHLQLAPPRLFLEDRVFRGKTCTQVGRGVSPQSLERLGFSLDKILGRKRPGCWMH